MTATTCAISYYNVITAVASFVGTWESNATLENVLTPRLGQVAIQTDFQSAGFAFRGYVSTDSPTLSAKVGVLAMLNVNIISDSEPGASIAFIMTMDDGSIYSSTDPGNAVGIVGSNSDGTFQSHIIWIPSYPSDPSFESKRMESVLFLANNAVTVGSIDPYTGVVTAEPLRIGGIWAGPKFAPRNGIKLEAFNQAIVDSSSVVVSAGGQVWADAQVRQRTMGITFAALYESEVYALAPAQCLQQLAAYCGVSRPLIVVPSTSDSDLVYSQSIYGYMTSPAKWNVFDKSGDDGTLTRMYSGTIDMVEAR